MALFNEITLQATGHCTGMTMAVDLDAYYEDAWHDIYEGIYCAQRVFTLPVSKEIEKIRVKYYWVDHYTAQLFDYTLLYEVYLTLNSTGKLLPNSHNDLGSSWANEQLAYDDNLLTGAWVTIPSSTWSSVLEFDFVGVGVVTDSISVPDPVANSSYEFGEGTGTVTGSNITERGFEVEHSFSGTLYSYIEHHIAGFDGNASLNGTVWEGTLTKTETETGSFSEGAFTIYLGRWPAHFSDKLFAGESYRGRAYAIIDGTKHYGDWMNFSLGNFPAGVRPDDQLPIGDIIPETGVPIDIPSVPGFEEPGWIPDYPPGYPPYEPPFGAMEDIADEFPGLELPEFEWPEFEYPDFPPYNGSWLGWFYYRKPYTKKDLDELRKKCRMFQDNSVEYALVLNHNSRVLQQFMNSMTDYMDADEHNTFRPIIPTQHLNTLARKPIDILGFKSIINNFISNSIDNTNNVNNNFRLIRDGLSDYAYTEDEGFTHISIKTRLVNDNNPDADRLKKVIDTLNKEMALNYAAINHNLHIVRSVLI